jgi:hypothetical protein
MHDPAVPGVYNQGLDKQLRRIKDTAARAQALNEGAAPGSIEELCPFQMMYEDGVKGLGAGSPREKMKWVSAIWYVLCSSCFASG